MCFLLIKGRLCFSESRTTKVPLVAARVTTPSNSPSSSCPACRGVPTRRWCSRWQCPAAAEWDKGQRSECVTAAMKEEAEDEEEDEEAAAAHLPSGAVQSLLHSSELRADKLLLAQPGSGLLQVLVGLCQPGGHTGQSKPLKKNTSRAATSWRLTSASCRPARRCAAPAPSCSPQTAPSPAAQWRA